MCAPRGVLCGARSVGEEVAELVPLDVEVGPILIRRRRHNGQPLDDLEPVPLETDQLHRIVRQHPDRGQPEVEQDLRADAVVPQVRLETELLVGFDGVVPLILQLIRLELVEEADASSFLIEVHDPPGARLRDHPHRAVQLPAAVAARRTEYVAGQALGVHPHQHLLLPCDLAVHQGDVLRLIHVIPIADDPEFAERGREPRLSDAMDQALVLQPVGDELCDGDEREPMLLREAFEVGTARHRPVGVEDLADDARGIQPGKSREGLATRGREWRADQPAGMRGHEIDHVGGALFGGADETPLVLAPLVIRHDDELACPNVRDRLFYCAERHSCLTYFPRTSASTCTRSPAANRPNVVCSRVNGTSDTCTTPGRGVAFTVRLTPSTVMAPCRIVTAATSVGTATSTSRASPASTTRATVATPST